MRSTVGRPAPRSMRAGNVSHKSFAPVASAIARASARLPIATGLPPDQDRGGFARAEHASDRPDDVFVDGPRRAACSGREGRRIDRHVTPRDVGRQDERRHLPGRTRTRPRRCRPHRPPTSSVLADQRMNDDTLRATVSMSDSSCASYCLWYVAWSPTMLTTGVAALRALCRFARPLPSPGPRCSSVHASRGGVLPRGRPYGHSRRPRPSPHLRTTRARRASPAPCRARRRSASPTCPGS